MKRLGLLALAMLQLLTDAKRRSFWSKTAKTSQTGRFSISSALDSQRWPSEAAWRSAARVGAPTRVRGPTRVRVRLAAAARALVYVRVRVRLAAAARALVYVRTEPDRLVAVFGPARRRIELPIDASLGLSTEQSRVAVGLRGWFGEQRIGKEVLASENPNEGRRPRRHAFRSRVDWLVDFLESSAPFGEIQRSTANDPQPLPEVGGLVEGGSGLTECRARRPFRVRQRLKDAVVERPKEGLDVRSRRDRNGDSISRRVELERPHQRIAIHHRLPVSEQRSGLATVLGLQLNEHQLSVRKDYLVQESPLLIGDLLRRALNGLTGHRVVLEG